MGEVVVKDGEMRTCEACEKDILVSKSLHAWPVVCSKECSDILATGWREQILSALPGGDDAG